jgi:hypothetical protein
MHMVVASRFTAAPPSGGVRRSPGARRAAGGNTGAGAAG